MTAAVGLRVENITQMIHNIFMDISAPNDTKVTLATRESKLSHCDPYESQMSHICLSLLSATTSRF